MNGQDTLSLKDLLAIAVAWKDAKDRRRVNDRINIPGLVSHSADDLIVDENYPEFDVFELPDMMDCDSFWL